MCGRIAASGVIGAASYARLPDQFHTSCVTGQALAAKLKGDRRLVVLLFADVHIQEYKIIVVVAEACVVRTALEIAVASDT